MKDELRLPAPTDVAIARLKSLRGEPASELPERKVSTPLRLTSMNATDRFQRILRGEPPDESGFGDIGEERTPANLSIDTLHTELTDWDTQDAVERHQSAQGGTYELMSRGSAVMSRAREFTKEHVAVILVIVVVAAVFTVSQLLRAHSQEVPLAPPTVVVTGNSVPDSSATPTPPTLMQIHVLGAVATPGVVALPVGARVHEAIAACGGLREDADPEELNLAAVLSDGAQIIIGVRGSPQGTVIDSAGASGQGSSAGVKVNLNTATSAQLETLPGVGPVTAGRIIAWREAHGKFSTTSELQEVSGIGPKTFAQLEQYVCV